MCLPPDSQPPSLPLLSPLSVSFRGTSLKKSQMSQGSSLQATGGREASPCVVSLVTVLLDLKHQSSAAGFVSLDGRKKAPLRSEQ